MAALRGLVSLYSLKPHHPVSESGRMALSDHVRELRGRVLRAVTALAIVFIASLFFFDQLFEVVAHPYELAQEALGGDRTMATTSGVGGGFTLYLKLCGLASVVITSPVWLYQLWAFILPGLHRRERTYTRVFVSIAGPLFVVGVVLGYVTLPTGVQVLIGFTPHGLTNLTDFNDYLSFFSRTLLVFGLAFEIPVFIVLLNFAGVVKGAQLGRFRAWIVIASFVFAAAATPSTDPITMTLLAIPMVALFLVSEVIARVHDRLARKRDPYQGLSPDEASSL